MNIYGKRVVLRAMTRKDSGMILKMFNDPEIEQQVGGWSFPLSAEQQDRWFDNHMNDADKRFVIEDSEFGAVGILRFSDLDWKNKEATIGFKIADQEHRGKGIGTDAYMAMIRYCFDELGLHRINASYFDNNIASKTVHQKCGFVEEGKTRESKFQNGRYYDMVFVGLLEREYRNLVSETRYWD